jgi:hypothetical protein
MNTENKRIPFDWEKYQSGEFEAVCRDGRTPEQIVYYPRALTGVKITALVDGEIETFNYDGSWKFVRGESEFDLLLIPKPKKFQAWVNCYDTGAAISWSNEDIAKQYEQMNNGFVKTILIEWEG